MNNTVNRRVNHIHMCADFGAQFFFFLQVMSILMPSCTSGLNVVTNHETLENINIALGFDDG